MKNVDYGLYDNQFFILPTLSIGWYYDEIDPSKKPECHITFNWFNFFLEILF